MSGRRTFETVTDRGPERPRSFRDEEGLGWSDRSFDEHHRDTERGIGYVAHPERRYQLERLGQWSEPRGQRGFAGRGPRSYRRPDERIREEVCERLTAARVVDATHVEVEVKDGEVTLRGWVEERAQKRAAEDIAGEARGVSDVHNRIALRAGDARLDDPLPSEAPPRYREEPPHSRLERLVQRIEFPASRSEILATARALHVPAPVIRRLTEQLPEGEFRGPSDVLSALGERAVPLY